MSLDAITNDFSTTIRCPLGSVFNTNTQLCSTIRCPLGTTLNTVTNLCSRPRKLLEKELLHNFDLSDESSVEEYKLLFPELFTDDIISVRALMDFCYENQRQDICDSALNSCRFYEDSGSILGYDNIQHCIAEHSGLNDVVSLTHRGIDPHDVEGLSLETTLPPKTTTLPPRTTTLPPRLPRKLNAVELQHIGDGYLVGDNGHINTISADVPHFKTLGGEKLLRSERSLKGEINKSIFNWMFGY